ncbi:MAG: cation transporter, partial [Caulobacteraceae bacterium]
MALIEQVHPALDLSAFVRRDDHGGEQSLDLLVKGARCAGCIGKIEKGVAALPGVTAARLNLTTGRLAVRGISLDAARIVGAVDGLGYSAVAFDPQAVKSEEDREGRRLLLALGVAAFGAGNVMMFSIPAWAGMFGQEMGVGMRTLMYWLSALVAAPCTLYAGMPFFRSAWASVKRGKANMDVPITIGVLLTLAISFSETIQRGPHAY